MCELSAKTPASYRGCAKYKQYKEHILKIQPKATRTNLIKRQTRKPDVDISQTNNNTLNKNTPTYAEVTKLKTNKTTNSNEPVQMQQLEDILDKMFNKMQTMMINMVDNMMDRWEEYRDIITEETQLTVSLKTVEEVEQAIEDINKLIHSAANRSTPQGKAGRAKEHVYPTFIRDSVTERRRLRREWQNNHYARDKTAFNKASQQLKALTKNGQMRSCKITLQN
ncbi:hypothetical protein EVAR_58205_1 [Eumeta japonica]|uniref:Uncharacterized protein n=1 Tax=Eumeta variegata TaxID=151549 RepID=A0A4C1YVR2_EUMVA|nr:hypothetical protein EVAR_58205_1 [Eumeta japonica]